MREQDIVGDEVSSQTHKDVTKEDLEAFKRRAKRNQRRAWADGYLLGVCAMLQPGDIALDLGANMGVVTAQLAATGARVIAYEPDPFAFGTLQQKFSETPNVTLVNAAVGIGGGVVRLMRADNFADNPEGASVKSTILDGGRRIDAANSIEVPLLDFPNILSELGEVAFVKMDIEGAELDILERMHQDGLFAKVRCLVAETHERKFKDLRPRYRALREEIAQHYHPGRVNLDWI